MDAKENSFSEQLDKKNTSLKEWAEERGVDYFLVSYSSLNTSARTSIVPTTNIDNVQKNGCGFPSGMYFVADASQPEVYCFPDVGSVLQLPWKKEYAWVSSNIYMYGKPFAQCPRTRLEDFARCAHRRGYRIMSGVEPEFLVFDLDSNAPEVEREELCLHDPHALMAREPFMRQIVECMRTLDWAPYMVDHEAAKGQYEVNFGYTDALTTADRYEFMKFMIKELAKLHKLKVTFMPKASSKLLGGSGLHINVSIEDTTDGSNICEKGTLAETDISDSARYFVGGLLKRTRDMTAVLCPTINSYKRINGGAYCPKTITWGGNNRSVLIRVPCNNRVEHRLADATTNLYLAQLLIFSAGMQGMQDKTEPGDAVTEDILLKADQFPKIAETLNEAIADLERSEFVGETLGPELQKAFVVMKRREIDMYNTHVSKWEQDYYFNC